MDQYNEWLKPVQSGFCMICESLEHDAAAALLHCPLSLMFTLSFSSLLFEESGSAQPLPLNPSAAPVTHFHITI